MVAFVGMAMPSLRNSDGSAMHRSAPIGIRGVNAKRPMPMATESDSAPESAMIIGDIILLAG